MWSVISKLGNRAPSGVDGSTPGCDDIVDDCLLLRGHISLGDASEEALSCSGREILRVGTQISIKAPICGGSILTQLI